MSLDLRCELMPDAPPAPGLHENVPFGEYRRWAACNPSLLKAARPSMLHAKAAMDGLLEKDETPALAFGSLVHDLLLEPDRSDVRVVPDFGDTRKGKGAHERRAQRDEWIASQPEHVIVATEDDMALAHEMLAQVRSHPVAAQAVGVEGRRELSMVWECPATGLMCKGRIDIEAPSKRLLIDPKTTKSAARWSFAADVAKFGYHLQSTWYQWGYGLLTGKTFDWLWLAFEKEPPYACALYAPDDEMQRTGRVECRELRNKLVASLKSGKWPGYAQGVTDLELPRYAVASEFQTEELGVDDE
jgi:exodeoxyribonuclease VIII